MHKPIEGDELVSSDSYDNALLEEIQATHSPDGRDFEADPLLYLAEDIFKHASPLLDDAIVASASLTRAHPKALEDPNFIGTPEALALVIDQVANQIARKHSNCDDAHSTAIAVLDMLTHYSWDLKLVISIAAFAMSYGEFWLIAKIYTSNQLAKSLATLKRLPAILEHTFTLKLQSECIQNIIKPALDITKCIVEFKDLPYHYIAMDDLADPPMRDIPLAVYWTIRSIMACSSQIFGLLMMDYDLCLFIFKTVIYDNCGDCTNSDTIRKVFLIGHHRDMALTTEAAWELSSLAHKLRTRLGHLQALIDEVKRLEFNQIISRLFEMPQIDNMKILKALFYAKDDPQPLLHGTTKKREGIDVLREKYVLLLISDHDITGEEVCILEHIYNCRGQENQYEVVWFPILNSTIPWTEQFEKLQAIMPWYMLYNPWATVQASKFIKEEWHFAKKPIIVVLDPHGRVASLNAFHMMWIWGNAAFPFTTLREEALWKEESWRFELLVDGIDPLILDWIKEGRYICLYGGEDIEWIRKFTSTAYAVAQLAGIPLEMVYVGRSNPKERIKRINSTIILEKLSHYWQDLIMIWFFWVRVESMWFSKAHLGRTIENDQVMQEILTILSYDGSDDGWAILGRGSADDMIIKAKGSTFLTCLSSYNAWRSHVNEKGFLAALRDHLMELQTPRANSRLVLPETAKTKPEKASSSEGGLPNDKFVMYRRWKNKHRQS